jgi:hypothetical protein
MRGNVVVLWLTAISIVNCVLSGLRLYLIHSRKKKLMKNINIYTIYVIIIAFSVDVVAYASTYYKLKKQSRNIALQNSNECRAQGMRILKEKRFLKTIIIIACIAFVCIVPSVIFFAYMML